MKLTHSSIAIVNAAEEVGKERKLYVVEWTMAKMVLLHFFLMHAKRMRKQFKIY